MSRRGVIFRLKRRAGVIEEIDEGFRFAYDRDYAEDRAQPPVSLTLPKRLEPYESRTLFACFVALLAEGALAEVQCRHLRIDERDLFGRLLKTCTGDVIGSLRVEELP